MVRSRQISFSLVSLICCIWFVPAAGQSDTLEKQPKVFYGDKGWHLETANGNFASDFHLRLQLRYSYPFEQDPISLEDFHNEKQHNMQIRRARMKIGGHAFTRKLQYYMEYELAALNLLDFWAIYSFNKAVRIQAGQYKARYNTERIISSGRLQTADRSILTRPFTIDRQTGLTLFGNLSGQGALNFSYWLAVFSGTGRGQFVPDDDALMWKFRGQWNMFGKEMDFVASDIKQLQVWRGYLAGGVGLPTRANSPGSPRKGADNYADILIPGNPANTGSTSFSWRPPSKRTDFPGSRNSIGRGSMITWINPTGRLVVIIFSWGPSRLPTSQDFRISWNSPQDMPHTFLI